jgi:hypothetical protein
MIIKSSRAKDQSAIGQALRIVSCALVVGLIIPTAHFGFLRLSAFWPINTPTGSFIATYTLLCLGSYLSAGLLLTANQLTRRSGYGWAFLSIMGSFVLALVYTFRPLPLSELSFSELLLVHFRDALGTTFWLSIFTAPISASVYYSMSFFNSSRIQHVIGPQRGSRVS